MLIGVYLANRTGEADAPSTFFPTLNLVPLRVVGLSPEADLVAVAKTVQQDIHAVSSHGRADVGLWEIYEWTGVTVDSFVNFLSLPDEGPSPSTANVTVTPVKGGDVTATGGSFDSSVLLGEPWLQRNAVADAYPVRIALPPFPLSAACSSLDLVYLPHCALPRPPTRLSFTTARQYKTTKT